MFGLALQPRGGTRRGMHEEGVGVMLARCRCDAGSMLVLCWGQEGRAARQVYRSVARHCVCKDEGIHDIACARMRESIALCVQG